MATYSNESGINLMNEGPQIEEKVVFAILERIIRRKGQTIR